MNAEIVRADEIKAGDCVLLWGQTLHVISIDLQSTEHDPLLYMEYRDADDELHSARFWSQGLIARILPAPLEVREFWRVRYEHYRDTPDGKGFYTRRTDASPTKEIAVERYRKRHPDSGKTMSFAKDATIEHVRETILSREEVKP